MIPENSDSMKILGRPNIVKRHGKNALLLAALSAAVPALVESMATRGKAEAAYSTLAPVVASQGKALEGAARELQHEREDRRAEVTELRRRLERLEQRDLRARGMSGDGLRGSPAAAFGAIGASPQPALRPIPSYRAKDLPANLEAAQQVKK